MKIAQQLHLEYPISLKQQDELKVGVVQVAFKVNKSWNTHLYVLVSQHAIIRFARHGNVHTICVNK